MQLVLGIVVLFLFFKVFIILGRFWPFSFFCVLSCNKRHIFCSAFSVPYSEFAFVEYFNPLEKKLSVDSLVEVFSLWEALSDLSVLD